MARACRPSSAGDRERPRRAVPGCAPRRDVGRRSRRVQRGTNETAHDRVPCPRFDRADHVAAERVLGRHDRQPPERRHDVIDPAGCRGIAADVPGPPSSRRVSPCTAIRVECSIASSRSESVNTPRRFVAGESRGSTEGPGWCVWAGSAGCVAASAITTMVTSRCAVPRRRPPPMASLPANISCDVTPLAAQGVSDESAQRHGTPVPFKRPGPRAMVGSCSAL